MGTPVPDLGVSSFDLIDPAHLDAGARIGSTVVRVHLKVQMHWEQAAAGGLSNHIGLGLIIGPAGLSSVGPVMHANSADWMMHQELFPNSTAPYSYYITVGTTVYAMFHEFDVRSSRVMQEVGDTLNLLAQPQNVGSPGGALLAGWAWKSAVYVKLA